MKVETRFKPGDTFARIDMTERKVVEGIVTRVSVDIRTDGVVEWIEPEGVNELYKAETLWSSKHEALADLTR